MGTAAAVGYLKRRELARWDCTSLNAVELPHLNFDKRNPLWADFSKF
jgi:hypothetical protein